MSANTHTHGLDDIACPERLVGECVIEREVAHAVAIERNAAADWLETYKDQRIEGLVLDIRLGIHTIDDEATR